MINLLGGHDDFAPYNMQVRMFIVAYLMYYCYFVVSKVPTIRRIMNSSMRSNKICTDRALVIF